MNVSVTITRPPSLAFGHVTDETRKLVTDAVRQVGLATQQRLRQQVTSSLRNARGVANAWRIRFYPADKPSLGAAAVISTRAPNIINAFDAGVVIGPKNARYLAIPLPGAGPVNVGGKRITPSTYAARTGQRLVFVERTGKSALLVTKPPRGAPGAPRPAPVAVFVLVRQVNPGKRLDVASVQAQGSSDLAREIAARLAAQT